MADTLRWEFTLGKSPLADPVQALRIIERHMTRATQRGLFAWEAEAARRTPVDIGRLRAGYSTTIEVAQPLTIVGTLRNDVAYALPVEEGQTAHWPPWGPGSALARWAERKFGDRRVAFLVARKIASGTARANRGVFMVKRSLRKVTPMIQRFWRTEWQRAIAEINRG